MKLAEPDLTHMTGHAGPVAEFYALRDEIQQRFKAHQHLLSLQLTLSAAVFGFAVSTDGMIPLLLILPFSSYLLCGRLVAQHFGIQRVAGYIANHLGPRVPGGLCWEQWLGTGRRHPHLLGSTLPLALTFVGTSVLALAWTGYASQDSDIAGGLRIGLVALWSFGVLATVVSCVLLLQQSGWLRARGWERASVS